MTIRLFALLAALLCAAAPAAAAIPDDVLVVGQVAEPKSLDPHAVTALNDFRILANVYDGLVRYRDGTLDVAPALAERWEISDDGRVYTFFLRDGVRFHDGSAFDAAAVKFNFERMLDPAHPFHHTGPFPLAFFFEAIARVEVVDPLTVRLHLAEPFAPLLSNLAYPAGLMVSPAAVRAHGADYGRQPSGTGPFRFKAWESGRRVMLERNPEHWDGAPALRLLVFRPLADANTRYTELLTGGIDIMVEGPAEIVAALKGDPAFRVLEQSGPHLWYLILETRSGPFADKRMRQAVNLAVDKQALVDSVLRGTATVAAGPVPQAFGWAHDPDLEPYPHDPDRARALIAEAGAAGAELTLFASEGGSGMLDPVAMAVAIQADLAAVGLDVQVRTFEWNSYLARVNEGLAGQAEMAEMAWMTNDPDTLPWLALRSGAAFNSGGYSNPEVDRLIDAGRRTTDRAGRAAIYRELQRLVHDDAPWLFVANWKQNAVATARVRGLALQPSFLLRLQGVRKE